MTNAKTTKKALFASVMSLLLCISMLIGTTFAWFTDTASTGVNKIQSGTLDVDLVTADNDHTSLTEGGQSLSFKNVNNETDILWEPNVTFKTGSFMVANKGNLALKYSLLINGLQGDSELLDVITFSVVSVSTDSEGNDTTTELKLEDFEGTLTPAAEGSTATYSDEMYIKAHMDEDAGNFYQDKTLDDISITVVATQWTYEKDSVDNQYDADAEIAVVSDATELQAALNANKDVVLANDIVLTAQLTIPEGVTFDGNGYTVTANGIDGDKNIILIDKDNVVLKNVILDSNGTAKGLQAYDAQNVYLENVTLLNSAKSGLNVNGSIVVAHNLNGSGNTWGDVNVDNGSAVENNELHFTITGDGVLAGGNDGQIWSEYSAECVTADGYTYSSDTPEDKTETYHYWNKTTE